MSYKKGLLGCTVEHVSEEMFKGRAFGDDHRRTGVVVDKVKTKIDTFYLIANDVGQISKVKFYLITKIIPITEFEKVTD
jgi:hypothetical protein